MTDEEIVDALDEVELPDACPRCGAWFAESPIGIDLVVSVLVKVEDGEARPTHVYRPDLQQAAWCEACGDAVMLWGDAE